MNYSDLKRLSVLSRNNNKVILQIASTNVLALKSVEALKQQKYEKKLPIYLRHNIFEMIKLNFSFLHSYQKNLAHKTSYSGAKARIPIFAYATCIIKFSFQPILASKDLAENYNFPPILGRFWANFFYCVKIG